MRQVRAWWGLLLAVFRSSGGPRRCGPGAAAPGAGILERRGRDAGRRHRTRRGPGPAGGPGPAVSPRSGAGGGASAAEPAHRAGPQVLVDMLGLAVLVQARRAQLTADAGLTEAAPFGLREVGVEVVDPHGAVAQPRGDPAGARGVGGPDGACQAVLRVVGEGHGLIFGAEGLNRKDRAKRFLT